MFLQASVILLTAGGVCTPPPGADTPRADPPRSRHTPPEQTSPRADTHTPTPEQTPPRSRPPPKAEHARRYGQRAGGTHPTGMQSCFGSYIYALLQ